MTIAELQKQFWNELSKIYDEREAKAITKIVLEKKLELSAHQLSLERFRILTSYQQNLLNEILVRLLTHEPVQYVLEEADFFGSKFKVNKHVLIPRPETEELVAWVIELLATNHSPLAILDIGTGSGCIPVSLSKKFPSAKIEACDISENALRVAEKNNLLNQTNVTFFECDILNENLPEKKYDIIVSNPPYITEGEKKEMAENVLKFEPHLALFVPENDALIFYRKMVELARHSLKPNSKLFFEINASKGEEVVSLLRQFQFKNIELKRDLSGRERMVKGENDKH